jgi:hypothetical protein
LEVQVHHLISLGGWNDVIHLSIYLSDALGVKHLVAQFGLTLTSRCLG